jgi:hypothetical protein
VKSALCLFLAHWRHSGALSEYPLSTLAEIQTAHFLSGCAIVAELGRTLPFVSA